MLYIKMMSGEDMADDDSRKGFTIHTVGDKDVFEFEVRPDGESPSGSRCFVTITREDGNGLYYPLLGNAYVMNAQGKTIQTCAPR